MVHHTSCHPFPPQSNLEEEDATFVERWWFEEIPATKDTLPRREEEIIPLFEETRNHQTDTV